MSSSPIPAPPPDASATVRGLVNTGAQTFAGAKTFTGVVVASNISGSTSGSNSGDVTLSAVGSSPNANGASLVGQALNLQPANGTNPGVVTTGAQTFAGVKTFVDNLQLSANKGLLGSTNNSFQEFSGGWITGSNTRLDSAGFYVASGGILGGLSASGLGAAAGSYGADVAQGQSGLPVAVYSVKGAASGVVVKIGTSQATPHASAELLRVGYGNGGFLGSDGTAVFKVLGGNRVICGSAASAPTDTDLMSASISFYLDEAGNNLKVRVKYSNGTTLKTATVALV